VTDGDMEKLRELFVFVCFIVAVGTLFLGAFQAWNKEIASASALGVIFVVCAVFLFFPQIKAFKVGEAVQVELRETLNEAQSIIERLRKLSAISARASYLTIAWGNRPGTPPAKEKQAVLDEIDSQLAELDALTKLKVSPAELAEIHRPFVKMVRLDFFFLFQRVLSEYAGIINSGLIANIHAAKDDPSAATAASMRHSELMTVWTKRTRRDDPRADPSADLEKAPLEDVLNEYMPRRGEWLDGKELAAVQKFKAEIVRLNADCEKKGGYTAEAATYYDRYAGDHSADKAKQLRNEVLQ
jgi:hypothetical protein